MIFDAKIFVALVFVVVSFLTVLFVKNRTTAVTTLIISHLILVLFFSLVIPSYNSFKEIVIALVVYSMVLLFLVSNNNPILLVAEEKQIKKRSRMYALIYPLIGFGIIVITAALFFVTKTVPEIAKNIYDKKFERQNEIMLNPMILPSHPVHVAVRKFYLGKKMATDGNEWVDKVQVQSEMNEKKQARLKDKLSDNFLLKRSSDVIMIIVAISTSLLLLGARKIENNNENNS